MKQVPDRKKLRRDYLKSTIKGTIMKIMSWLMVGPVIVLGCAAILVLMFSMVVPLEYMPYMLLGALSIVAISVYIYRFSMALEKQGEHALCVPYVPPVTADTLPVEEILVRGAEEPPVVECEMLLRAAKEQETPQEELLRVSQE